MTNRRRCLILIPLVCCGCTQGARQDTTADVESIEQVREREIKAFTSGNTDSLLAVVESGALVLPPDEPAVRGHDAIRTWAADMHRQFNVSGSYTDAQVEVTGDWAIERYTGSWTVTPKAGGAAATETLKGIHTYRRQADGRWLIVHDIWNRNAPPPAAGR